MGIDVGDVNYILAAVGTKAALASRAAAAPDL
jgi:hypothetical protein